MLSDGAVWEYQPMPPCLEDFFIDATNPEGESTPPFMSYSGYPIPGVHLGAVQPSPYDQMPYVSASSSRSPAPIVPLAAPETVTDASIDSASLV